MILDTNALSALAARESGVMALISEAPRLCITLISLGEYEYGLRFSQHRTALQNWLRAFLVHADVLSPNQATLEFYADLRVHLKMNGTPIAANDCWIAALARQHRMPIISRDTHFDLVPNLRRLSW